MAFHRTADQTAQRKISVRADTPQWLEHLQKASVRFNSGGSGSFVSANGLVITNHHVGADCYLPYVLRMFNRREVLELAYSARSFENARKAREDVFGVQNNRKRYDGYLAGLLDPQIWSQLKTGEQKLRDAIGRDPKFKSTTAAYD